MEGVWLDHSQHGVRRFAFTRVKVHPGLQYDGWKTTTCARCFRLKLLVCSACDSMTCIWAGSGDVAWHDDVNLVDVPIHRFASQASSSSVRWLLEECFRLFLCRQLRSRVPVVNMARDEKSSALLLVAPNRLLRRRSTSQEPRQNRNVRSTVRLASSTTTYDWLYFTRPSPILAECANCFVPCHAVIQPNSSYSNDVLTPST